MVSPAHEVVPEPSWTWRNCRSVGLRFDLWLWPWALAYHQTEDLYGGERWLHVGPLGLGIAYSIGNASSEGLDRFTALSEAEAFSRSMTRRPLSAWLFAFILAAGGIAIVAIYVWLIWNWPAG